MCVVSVTQYHVYFLWINVLAYCLNRFSNVESGFNKEKALVMDFSVIVKLQIWRRFVSSSTRQRRWS